MKRLFVGLLTAMFLACGEGDPRVNVDVQDDPSSTETYPPFIELYGTEQPDAGAEDEEVEDGGATDEEPDAGTSVDGGSPGCHKKNKKCKKNKKHKKHKHCEE